MSEFLMKPRNDYAFKELMSVENVRIGFLSAILKLNPDDIKETHILNTDLKKMFPDDKLGILDVRLSLNDDTEIDIEVQISEVKVWAERSLFYLAKMYTEQIKQGEPYANLKKCVSISILDFKLFENESEFYSRFHIREDSRHFVYTDKMEFHVVELPKLPEELKEGDNILAWAKFINAERREEFETLAGRDDYFKAAYNQLQLISQDESKRWEYEAREKALRDDMQREYEYEQRGIRKGRAEGWAEGRAEGRKEIILSLLDSLSIEQIASMLKIPISEVQQVAES